MPTQIALHGYCDVQNTTTNPLKKIELPLIGWVVNAEIIDFISEVTLYQCFQNTHLEEVEITYYFPLNEGDSVCGFSAEYESGSVITGIVKERGEAVQEYAKANENRQRAALLESERSDVFKLSVGRLAPNEHIKITISYVSILTAEADDICFFFPTSIASLAPRCRPQHSDPSQLDPPSTQVVFHSQLLLASFKTASSILSITCPSHPSHPGLSIAIDGASATVAMPDFPTGPDIILLCAEEETRVDLVVETIAQRMGFHGEIQWDASQPVGQPRRAFRSLGKHEIAWEPKVGFQAGIAETVDWWSREGIR